MSLPSPTLAAAPHGAATNLLSRPLTLLWLGFALVLAMAFASAPAVADDVYYTQVPMWADKGVRVMGTNYDRGTFIPVNSEVRVQRVTRKAVVFTVPALGDQRIQLVNVPNHTQLDNQGLFDRTFGKEKVNLSRFNAKMVDHIKQGRVEIGMTRDEVIAARGYPPGHETPNLDLDHWRYWVNRFATNVVRFENGKVAEIIR